MPRIFDGLTGKGTFRTRERSLHGRDRNLGYETSGGRDGVKSQRPFQGHFAVSKTESYQKEQKQKKKKKNRVKKAVLVGPDQCEFLFWSSKVLNRTIGNATTLSSL